MNLIIISNLVNTHMCRVDFSSYTNVTEWQTWVPRYMNPCLHHKKMCNDVKSVRVTNYILILIK